jgi:uncharacterized membrane protein
MKQFLKTTIVGGVIFLLPVVLVLFFLGQALAWAAKLLEPVMQHLQIERFGALTGVSLVTILSAVFLILVSFAAGLVARTAIGASLTGWFDNSLLGRLPQYRVLKSMAEGMARADQARDTMKPVLVSVDCGWQLGYLLETLENGWVAVFLPQAPTPMSGNVMYVPADCLRALDMTMTQATTLVKSIGIGSRKLLRSVELAPAAARPQLAPATPSLP